MSDPTQLIDLTTATDFDLNDLPERVSFAPWPKGIFHVTVEGIEDDSREFGEGNIVPGIMLKLNLDSIVEVATATEASDLPAPGANTEFFFPYIGTDEKGTKRAQGEIKNMGAPFAIHCGSAKKSDWAPAAKGLQCTLVTNLTKRKREDGTERVYSNLVSITIGHNG